jgi:hypothetical protein
MANAHRYGFRFVRSINGYETPQTLTFPIASGYAPNTIDGGGGTACNLNIGDPVRIRQDGTIRLVQTGQDTSADNAAQADYAFGVIAGFPRMPVNGFIRPNSFYTSGTTYSGGIGADAAPVALVIPVSDNIFEIDSDAVLGTATRSGALGLVGQTTKIAYSVLTVGTGQPKANPLLNIAGLSTDGTVQNQLVIVGVGATDQDQDYTATNVTFQVMFTTQQLATATATTPVYGAKN